MKLTANFDTTEFDVSEPWPANKVANRLELARIFQRVRELAKVPVIVTSAFRSEAHNREVGGSEASQHLAAEAGDGVALLASPRHLAQDVLNDIAAAKFPPFGQIIFYADTGHIHMSLPRLGPRNGEVRYSYVANGVRQYPMLKTAAALPLLSDKQKALGVAIPGVTLLAIIAVILLAPSRAW